MALFPRLQVCFALILCFISQKRGLSWRPDEVGPTTETHRPRFTVQGLGQWLTGEGVPSLFSGGRVMPQEESIGELEESEVILCSCQSCQTPGSLVAPPQNHTSQAGRHLLPALDTGQL